MNKSSKMFAKNLTSFTADKVILCCFFVFVWLGIHFTPSGFQKLCGIQSKCYLLFKSIKGKEIPLGIVLMPTAFPAFTPATCMPLSRALVGSSCLFSNLFYQFHYLFSVKASRTASVQLGLFAKGGRGLPYHLSSVVFP